MIYITTMFGFPWHGLDDRKAAKSHVFDPSTDGNHEVKTYYVYTYITRWWFGTFYMFPYIGNNNPK